MISIRRRHLCCCCYLFSYRYFHIAIFANHNMSIFSLVFINVWPVKVMVLNFVGCNCMPKHVRFGCMFPIEGFWCMFSIIRRYVTLIFNQNGCVEFPSLFPHCDDRIYIIYIFVLKDAWTIHIYSIDSRLLVIGHNMLDSIRMKARIQMGGVNGVSVSWRRRSVDTQFEKQKCSKCCGKK